MQQLMQPGEPTALQSPRRSSFELDLNHSTAVGDLPDYLISFTDNFDKQEIIELQSLHDDRATQSLFFNDPEHPEVLTPAPTHQGIATMSFKAHDAPSNTSKSRLHSSFGSGSMTLPSSPPTPTLMVQDP